MTEPLVPILAPKTKASILDAMTREGLMSPMPHDGLQVAAQWVQGQGASVAVRIQVKNITGAVVAEKTENDLRALALLGIVF